MTSLFVYAASVISCILLITALIFVLLKRKKTILQHYCCLFILSLIGWIFSLYLQDFFNAQGDETAVLILENIKYLFVSTAPVFITIIAISFAHMGARIHPALFSLFIIPIATQFFLWTNESLHLFYTSFTFTEKPIGPYFYVHAVYSYVCLVTAIAYYMYFYRHSDKSTRGQAILISIGTIIPTIVNFIYSFDILAISVYATPIAFSVTAIANLIAMKKFNFLVNTPVLLRTIVDRVSYIFIALDTDWSVLDFNKTAAKAFPEANLKTGMNFFKVAQDYPNAFEFEKIQAYIEEVKTKKKSTFQELVYNAPAPENKKYFYKTEFAPIIQNDHYMGCIIMGQDITQQKLDAASFLEQERLMSISKMMIGLVQNLQTPMLLIEKNTENISALTDEYMTPDSCKNLTPEEFQEIFIEIRQNLQRQKSNAQTVTSILTAISEQTAQLVNKKDEVFLIKELIDRLQYLIKDKLAKSNCTLKTTVRIPESSPLTGDVNSLAQVLCNLVMNSIQAYKGREGLVYLTIAESENMIQISVGDFAGGIPEEVQDKLFKQIVTTKGKQYTGIGLYMSHAAIIGRFHGKMWFTTKPHEGTEFFIALPLTEGVV